MSESESESSRSESPASVSPAPNHEPAGREQEIGEEPQSSEDTDSEMSAEYGREGLVVLWRNESVGVGDPLGPTAMARDFDIVVIHGLHGSRRPPWRNPGSADSGWISDTCRDNGRTVMSFGYDPLALLAGTRTVQAIRRVSIRLLEDLKTEQASVEHPQTRPIMFVAHDIGGIIVKDALTYAGLYPSRYGGIFDYTRVLLFYGCPHQSVDRLDMEDRLSRFLLAHRVGDTSNLKGVLPAAKGLAGAVIDINSLFLHSKHAYRSHVLSIFNDAEESLIDKAFDAFAGTLRFPFEKRVAGGVSSHDDALAIETYFMNIQSRIYPDEKTVDKERILLSIARPIPTLTTADQAEHAFAWIAQNDTYKSWLNQKSPQLLYLHGSAGVRQAGEFVFYDLDQEVSSKGTNEMVLYFTFDRFDNRCDTTADMLTTFLAQIICHNPNLSEFVVNQFQRLALDRSWSDYDLLTWFEYYRLRGQVDGVSCVINHFEECEEESRQALLALFTRLSKTTERPWKLVVTSRELGALSDTLGDWPSIDLDKPNLSGKLANGGDAVNMWMASNKLYRVRPELRGEGTLEDELRTISQLDVSVRDLALAQLSQHPDWPQKTTEAILGPLKDISVESIFEMAMARIPDAVFARRALSWIVYSVRPLTVWELAMAMFIDSEDDDGEKLTPGAEYTDEIISRLLKWGAGILVLEQQEIRIQSPHLRHLLQSGSQNGVSSVSRWKGIPSGVANRIISDACFNILLRDSARKVMEDVYGEGKDTVMDLPTMGDRSNLCSYAFLYWADHLAKIPAEMDPSGLLEKFIGVTSPIWSKAHWALANPIQRSETFFVPLYPILTALGLADIAEPLPKSDKDISNGLIEACLNGYPKVVEKLITRIEHSEEALGSALIAAGSNGHSEIWKAVIRHVRQKHETFDWPQSLLARAAWLGLEEIVEELLEVGCDPNPTETIQMASPLHLAARNGHRGVAKVLLDHNADANHVGQYGRNVVQVATVFGHDEVVELLVKEGHVDINAKDDDSVTAVYAGSLWGNWKAVETLLKLGADPDLGDSRPGVPQWNPLVCAVEEGNIECVRVLLEAGADANFQGTAGTVIRYAVNTGLPQICRMLIEKGADLNHPSIDTPILMYALNSARQGRGEQRLETVKLLVDHKVNLDVVDGMGLTPLYHACMFEDEETIDLVSYLLERGVDVNGRCRHGETALHVAVRRRNLELMKLLLAKGINVNPPIDDLELGSPLHLAVGVKPYLRPAANGKKQAPKATGTEMTGLLLEHGADPSPQAPKVQPVLIRATGADELDTLKLLLDHRPMPDLEEEDVSFEGYTALAYAVAWGYADAVRMLADAGANVNHKIRHGQTIMHIAVDDAKSLPALLEFRPNVDAQDEYGDTPLHGIASWTPLDNVKLLVRGGAKLDIANKEGMIPLSRAIQVGNFEAALHILAKSGPEAITSVSPVQGSPLHVACNARHLEIVKLLVERGADVNLAVSSFLGTPLQSTIIHVGGSGPEPGPESVVELLLSSGADAAQRGGRFGTALNCAALQGTETLIRLLLNKGAEVDVADDMGRAPVHFAATSGEEQFGVIVDAGGDLLVPDKIGRSAISWAAQGGHATIVERILDIRGDEAVEEKDVDGWTPLCWAARGCGTMFAPSSTEKQVEVIKLLINRGASLNAKSYVAGKELRPVDIARYHSAQPEIVELLNIPGTETTKSADKDKEAAEGEEEKEKPPAMTLTPHYGAFCDYCLFDVHGIMYICQTCVDFALCYKCHHAKKAFHAAHHTFTEDGDEYVPLETPPQSSSTRSAGESVSDAGESDEDESTEETDDDEEDDSESEE